MTQQLFDFSEMTRACGLATSRQPTILVDPVVYSYGVALGLVFTSHENGFLLLGQQLDDITWFIYDLKILSCEVSGGTWTPTEDAGDAIGTWHVHQFEKGASLDFSPTDLGDEGVVPAYQVSLLSNGIGVVTGMVRITVKCGAFMLRKARVCPYDPQKFPGFFESQSRGTTRKPPVTVSRTRRVPGGLVEAARADAEAQGALWVMNDDDVPWTAERQRDDYVFVDEELAAGYIDRLDLTAIEIDILSANGFSVEDMMAMGLTRNHMREFRLLDLDLA